MDKNSRKNLISQYKKQELKKDLINPNLADYAKVQLGINSGPFSPVEVSDDSILVETFVQKLNETAERIYKQDPRKYKSAENVITTTFPLPVKAVYYTNLFELMLETGDTDKFLYNSSKAEIDLTIQGFKLLGLEAIAEMIEGVISEKIEIEFLESNYESNLELINANRIDFIRSNSDVFKLD